MTPEVRPAWYVKASFGAEWGPMSAGTLLEMADNGALAGDDLARHDGDADWQPIPSVLDRLRSQPWPVDDRNTADAVPQTQNDSRTRPVEEDSTRDRPATMPEQPTPKKRRAGALPGWSNYWVSDSTETHALEAEPQLALADSDQPAGVAATSATVETTRNVVPDDSTPASSDEPSDSPSATGAINSEMPSDGDFAALFEWKRERKARLDRLLKIVSDREAAAREVEAAKVAAAQADGHADANGTVMAEGQTEVVTNPQAEDARKKQAPPAESWEQTLTRWKRSVPDWPVAAAVLIVMLAVWWSWPKSYGNIAAVYRTMYDELEELRERPNDKSGMLEFVQRSHAQLDEVIPWLQKHASPNQPDQQWLLWMGRDCLRPMLKQPLERDSKPEVTFKKLMAEWQRRNEPQSVTPDATRPGSAAADSPSRLLERKPATAGKTSRSSPATSDDADSDK